MDMNTHNALTIQDDESFRFDSFELNRGKRILQKDGKPLRLGARAMDILLALTQRPGVTLSNRELLERLWSDVVVEEGTIRVHVSHLRKVLRGAEPTREYVQNVAGRGYRFVGPAWPRRRFATPPVAHASSPTVPEALGRQISREHNLPVPLGAVVGRSRTIQLLAGSIQQHRFLTVSGAPGDGKSTVAACVAEVLRPLYAHGVCFVDLTAVSESSAVPAALARALDITTVSSDPLQEILVWLAEHSLLLVLDNCEQVMEAVARLAEAVLTGAPQIHVLTTSREPLRAVGEHVYELPPLDTPAAHDLPARTALLQFPAIDLFVERAGLQAGGGELHDRDLLLIAEACRRLSGNALAIEIAAAQARWLGLEELVASLRDSRCLAMRGRRTAIPRHQTLRASFDWSYQLLSPIEQRVFRCSSVFAGRFDAEGAAALIGDELLTPPIVFNTLIDLARKGLVVVDTKRGKVLFRLHDVPRAFAHEKLDEAQERTLLQRRYLRQWCSLAAAQIEAHASLWRSGQCRARPDLVATEERTDSLFPPRFRAAILHACYQWSQAGLPHDA